MLYDIEHLILQGKEQSGGVCKLDIVLLKVVLISKPSRSQQTQPTAPGQEDDELVQLAGTDLSFVPEDHH